MLVPFPVFINNNNNNNIDNKKVLKFTITLAIILFVFIILFLLQTHTSFNIFNYFSSKTIFIFFGCFGFIVGFVVSYFVNKKIK